MGRQSRYTVILSLCRDFTPSPWFCVTAVIVGGLRTSSAFEEWLLHKFYKFRSFARQHAMHAQRDIVLQIPPVRPSF